MVKASSDTGLVLEGGGFRGMFTAGVLDSFLAEQLAFGYVIGVSAGAAYGASYVSGQPERNLRVNSYVSDPNYCSWYHLLTKGEYFNPDFIYHYLPEHLVPFDFDAFDRSQVNMLVALTDCVTGEPDYKQLHAADRERFATLIAATSSLPFMAKPKTIDGRVYMDGGLSDSIPFRKALDDGMKRLVVILTRDASYRKQPTGMQPIIRWYYRRYPRLAEAICRRAGMYNRSLDELAELERQGIACVIRPADPLPVSRMENKPAELEKAYRIARGQMKSEMDRLREFLL
jgi:predicted patatin/cPLA2 family phospholipase